MAFADRSPIIMQGKIFVQERDFNGAPLTGLDWVGNSDNAVLSFKQKRESVKDSYTGRGLTIVAPTVETEIEFMMSALDGRMTNYAMGFCGLWGGAEDAGSVSGESIVMYNGKYVQLAKTGVSNVTVSGAVLNTDYVVDNAPGGLLRVLSSSTTIPEGTPLTATASYDYAANNGQVEGFVKSQKFYTIVVNGINVAQGNQPMVLRIHQVQLDATKKTDFIDKKVQKFEMGGELLLDTSIDPGDEEFSQMFTLRKG